MIEATKEDEGLLRQILSSFSCNKDEDIENFLHSRAVEFESLSKARTYLICDENQLMETNFCLDQIVIYGYISIALKILSVPYDVSNRKRKEIDGLSAKIHGEQIKDFSCYLIGQLSKNSSVQNNDISGAELLQAAYDVIMAAVDAVADKLGSEGRILVRESGTEPVIRVMVEAPDDATCEKYVSEVVDVIYQKGHAVAQ